ncbi:hypothetical protein DQM23_13685 [Lacticaseibacillus paracasei]|uniref:hypothetical protein n=1 Tax=Lacticaseibacillus paracasei TaxID=1597 RepID=UPI000E09B465|nr:hypothetical protein [Lacticaseibacillus paracasei]RDF87397.1 hypothetical protein DQM23_13685 [Lacticaseibacillus paracasei]
MDIHLSNDNNVKADAEFSDGTSFSYKTEFVRGQYSNRPEEDRYNVKINVLETNSEELKEALDDSKCLIFSFGRNGEYDQDYVKIGKDTLWIENPTSF